MAKRTKQETDLSKILKIVEAMQDEMKNKPTLLQKLEGYKTYIANSGVIAAGMAIFASDEIQGMLSNIDNQYVGIAFTILGAMGIGLRKVTKKPAGKEGKQSMDRT